MVKQIHKIEIAPALPYPSKSRCKKILRDNFGPRTRFMWLNENTIAIVEYVDGKHERHLVEVESMDPQGNEILYWAAFVSAFKAIGYEVERVGKDGKLTGLEMKPIWSGPATLPSLPTVAEIKDALPAPLDATGAVAPAE